MEDTAKVWKVTKTFMGWKSTGTPCQIVENDILYKQAKKVAEIMNIFFVQKILNLKSKFSDIPANYEHCVKAMRGKNCKLSMKYISQREILKVLTNLESSKSVGIDELDSYSLKLAANIIAPAVHHIVTLSIMQRKFPSACKLAKVLPLHNSLLRTL